MKTDNNLTIGRGTYHAGIGTLAYAGESIKIGSFCSIAQQVKLIAGGGHRRDCVSTFPFDVLMRGAKTGDAQDRSYEHGNGIEIGSDVHLGFGATILGHVKIGHGAVIAANATVFSDVPPYGIAVGNPARVLKYRFDERTIEALLYIAWWEWPDNIIRESIDDFYLSVDAFIERHDRLMYRMCPVCGLQGNLREWDICPCCGLEAGGQEDWPRGENWDALRQAWIDTGMQWWANVGGTQDERKPKDWNAADQLKNASGVQSCA